MTFITELRALILFLIFSTGMHAYGQTYRNEIGAMTDNDVYIAYMQDRYYTNGIFGYYRHALDQDKLKGRIEKKVMEFEAGQKIYNPFSANAGDVSLHDRPFTAYLYGGVAMNIYYQNEDILKISAQVGILGAGALGEQTQTIFHNVLGMYPVNGWEYQLNNEAAINTEVAYTHLFYRTTNGRLDISGASGALIGNTFTGANAGIVIRLGNFNQFHQSSYANSRVVNKTGAKTKVKNELFFFTKPQLNYAAYDATIEGGLFIKDKGPVTFGLKNLVYSQQLGVNFAAARWSSKFIVTLKSKELEGNAKAYHYGSIVLTYSYGKN